MSGRLLLAGLLLVVAGCSSVPEPTDPPNGLSAEVMQYRGKRLTRDIAIAVTNGTDREIDLTAMTLSSNRWSAPVDWRGAEQVGAGFGTGIDVDPPGGICPDGEELLVEADLTYRWGDQQRRSALTVDDPYGVLRDLVDGDCGERGFEAATRLSVGSPRISGDRWSADLTFTPRPEAEDVVFLGFAPTLRFAFDERTPTDVELPLDVEQRQRLDVVIGRCDPHVVAEDKVGTRFGVWVRTTELEQAYFTLQLDDGVRDSLEEFYADRCQP